MFAVVCIHATIRLSAAAPANQASPQLQVELEETVYSFEPANNGAGPMWCHGSTCLARVGPDVWATGLETLPGVAPLNNCRWSLWRRGPERWEKVWIDPEGRTREPSPLAVFGDGRLFVSANPTLVTNTQTYAGPARPELVEFQSPRWSQPSRTLRPVWSGRPRFTEHSYRSLAADGEAHELILFQNIDYTHAEWSFLNQSGQWSAQGQLRWPGQGPDLKGEPIRVCYPNVALRKRAVHFCGVSDIIEPNPEWRAFKKQLTGLDWDYDFRRLFYTWSDDVQSGRFHPWVELASRDRTAGWITPGDLWLASDQTVHVIWTERALDERLRAKFFPGEKQSHALRYATLRQGQVARRETILIAEEGKSREQPGRARFHATPDHRLLVLFYVGGADAAGKVVSELRCAEILRDGSILPASRVALSRPLTDFYATTARAGSPASDVIDLLGVQANTQNTISYARLRLGASRSP